MNSAADLTGRELGPFTVVLYQGAGMKEAWCLATSLHDAAGREIVDIYSLCFQCEEAFRDLKDRRYGYGLRFTRIRDCSRRDRVLLRFALAYVVQTLFGHASELIALDRELRANTAQERTHSLFQEGRSLLGEFAAETYTAVASAVRDAPRALRRGSLLDVLI